MTYIVGIDPGKKGGWAAKSLIDGEIVVGVMPLTGGEIDVRPLLPLFQNAKLVVLEKVHAMPGQGTKSMFTFGMGYGKLIGACQVLGTPFIQVAPTTWKKLVLTDTQKDKNAAIFHVKSKYPTVELIQERCRIPHDGIADAVCLMEYGARKHHG